MLLLHVPQSVTLLAPEKTEELEGWLIEELFDGEKMLVTAQVRAVLGGRNDNVVVSKGAFMIDTPLVNDGVVLRVKHHHRCLNLVHMSAG